eukprot:1960228-Rhodomonas_salina.1
MRTRVPHRQCAETTTSTPPGTCTPSLGTVGSATEFWNGRTEIEPWQFLNYASSHKSRHKSRSEAQSITDSIDRSGQVLLDLLHLERPFTSTISRFDGKKEGGGRKGANPLLTLQCLHPSFAKMGSAYFIGRYKAIA